MGLGTPVLPLSNHSVHANKECKNARSREAAEGKVPLSTEELHSEKNSTQQEISSRKINEVWNLWALKRQEDPVNPGKREYVILWY